MLSGWLLSVRFKYKPSYRSCDLLQIRVLSLVDFFLNPLQDLLSSMNAVISTNERASILTGHVTFKLRYNKIYQMKSPKILTENLVLSHS